MQQTKAKGLAGARLAQEYLKDYFCPHCGGRAVVGGKQVRVRHRESCQRERMIRLRWPVLRGGGDDVASAVARAVRAGSMAAR